MAAPTAALTAEALGFPVAARTVAQTVGLMVGLMEEPTVAQMVEPTVAQMVEPTEEPTVAQMVEPRVRLTAAPLAEDSVLARLIAVGRDRFADQHWGQQPLLSPAADLPGGFGALLSAAATDELVSQRGLRTTFLHVAK